MLRKRSVWYMRQRTKQNALDEYSGTFLWSKSGGEGWGIVPRRYYGCVVFSGTNSNNYSTRLFFTKVFYILLLGRNEVESETIVLVRSPFVSNTYLWFHPYRACTTRMEAAVIQRHSKVRYNIRSHFPLVE